MIDKINRGLVKSLTGIHILTGDEIEFVKSFGTPEKPMSSDEFFEFWNSLGMFEQQQLIQEFYLI